MPEISTQTFNNNTIIYKSPVLLNSSLNQNTSTTKYKELKDIVSIKHSNTIVTDATHTNICAYNDLIVKGNLFIGDILLTPKTVFIDINMSTNTSVPLHLDGNNGNILFHIKSSNQNNNLKLEIANSHNRQHGFIIFHNTSDYNITINFQKIISNTNLHSIIQLESKSVMYVSYFIINNKLLIRQPHNREMSHTIKETKIDKNDIENIIFQNSNQIKLETVENGKYLTAGTTNAQWIDLQMESEFCNLYSSSLNKIISLKHIQSTNITIHIDESSSDIYRVQSFSADKKTGEGTIIIKATNITNNTIYIKFLEGFIVDINSDFQLKTGTEELRFWYNHIDNGYTILRMY